MTHLKMNKNLLQNSPIKKQKKKKNQIIKQQTKKNKPARKIKTKRNQQKK